MARKEPADGRGTRLSGMAGTSPEPAEDRVAKLETANASLAAKLDKVADHLVQLAAEIKASMRRE